MVRHSNSVAFKETYKLYEKLYESIIQNSCNERDERCLKRRSTFDYVVEIKTSSLFNIYRPVVVAVALAWDLNQSRIIVS